MPSLKVHCRFSKSRTGRSFEELHRWMDEPQKSMGIRHRIKRHNLSDIEYVRKRWNDEGVVEFLVHLVLDFKDTKNKLERLFKKVKREKKILRKRYSVLLSKYSRFLRCTALKTKFP